MMFKSYCMLLAFNIALNQNNNRYNQNNLLLTISNGQQPRIFKLSQFCQKWLRPQKRKWIEIECVTLKRTSQTERGGD